MINFVKMHGLGNDFIMVDTAGQILPDDPAGLARKLCHRRFGIGGDGLILIMPSVISDIRMRIFNSDGSEAEMCGNGIRCLAKYAYERGLVQGTEFGVETLAGIIKPRIILEGGLVSGVKVDMGQPRLDPAQIPMIASGDRVVQEELEVDGEKYQVTAVSMGNPHCLLFVDQVAQYPIEILGPAIESHHRFPAKTNVEFIEVKNRENVKMRVWERGVGETMACGTGACATITACVLNGKTGRKIIVQLPGGDLTLEWAENDHIYLTGPAEEVFQGRV